jgi:hypothetical protein
MEGYNIIVDEVLDVVKGVVGKSSQSFQEFYLNDGYAIEHEDGRISPTEKWETLLGSVSDTLDPRLFKLAKAGTLYRVDGTFFVSVLSPALLRSAKSVTVFTYLAEGSVMLPYLRRFGIAIDHVVDADRDRAFRAEAKRLITLRQLRSLKNFKFSYSAQMSKRDKEARDKAVATSLKNLARRELRGVDLQKVLITCAKEQWYHNGDDTKGKTVGFSKGSRFSAAQWIPNTTRGTNDYADCQACVYLYDQYLNPYIKRWVGLGSDPRADDRYAVAEMIQWIYRSRVRRGEPIQLFIASPRMFRLLEDWLDGADVERPQLDLAA